MSSRDWHFRIEDILKSIKKIEAYIEGMTASQFKKNELVIDAVVRNLEIIGKPAKISRQLQGAFIKIFLGIK